MESVHCCAAWHGWEMLPVLPPLPAAALRSTQLLCLNDSSWQKYILIGICGHIWSWCHPECSLIVRGARRAAGGTCPASSEGRFHRSKLHEEPQSPGAASTEGDGQEAPRAHVPQSILLPTATLGLTTTCGSSSHPTLQTRRQSWRRLLNLPRVPQGGGRTGLCLWNLSNSKTAPFWPQKSHIQDCADRGEPPERFQAGPLRRPVAVTAIPSLPPHVSNGPWQVFQGGHEKKLNPSFIHLPFLSLSLTHTNICTQMHTPTYTLTHTY